MNRAFRKYTIQAGGTPQPVVGTYLTAAITQDQITKSSLTANFIPITVAVADSTMFLNGDYAVLVDPSTYAAERVKVSGPPSASNYVTLAGVQNPHPGGAYGTGAWLALGAFAQSLFIQGYAGNSGTLYIGTAPQMVASTGVDTFFQLTTVASGNPFYFSTAISGAVNADTLSQYWIDGTTGDAYLPSITVI